MTCFLLTYTPEEGTSKHCVLPPSVRLKGLEPPRREASDPKSDVATNYTTAALFCDKDTKKQE